LKLPGNRTRATVPSKALAFAALAGAAVPFAINATRARLEAEEQTRRTRSGELAARAGLIEILHPQAAGLLAVEAARVTGSAGDPLPNDSFQALLETASKPRSDYDEGSAWLWRIEGEDASPIRLDKPG
jgi:hypothetical protein